MKALVKVDPRVKLSLFIVTCVFVMSCTQVLFCMILGTFISLLLILSGKWGLGIRGILLYSLSVFGMELIHGRLSGGWSSLVFAIFGIIRIMLPILLSFKLVVKTTTISEFMSAFQKMRLSSKIIIPFAVMFRFIPTVSETWVNIRRAMAFRGISLNVFGVLRHPMRSLEYILIPMLFSATSVMEELAAAALARGLDSERKRSSLLEVRMTAFDYFCLLVVFLLFGVMIYNYL